jgi:hypothetical protein
VLTLRLVPPALIALALLAPAARAGVSPGASLDGPSPDILALGGVALAKDATGAAVYVKRDGGVPHVFAALLANGSWSPPQRVDPGVSGAATQPVVAAGTGGRVAIAFISGGTLYGTAHPAGPGAFTAPQAIAAANSNPSLAMGVSGAAYVSYTAPGPGGSDVRAARLDRTATSFTPLPDALNGSPASKAGDGAKRSRVTVAADGTGLVAWGEDGGDGRTHVIIRRVFGLNLSNLPHDVTLDQLAGHAGFSADSPDVGIQDDSSYAWVAYRQSFDAGLGVSVSRVIARELIGSELQPPSAADGLAFTPGDGAERPSIAINPSGDGLIASQLSASRQVIGSANAGTGFTPGQRINAADAARPPLPLAVLSRNNDGLVAFVPDAGSIQARLFDQGTPADQIQLSRPDYGPLDATSGLSAAADDHGNVIVGYLPGDAANRRVAIAAVVSPPGRFSGLTTEHYVRFARPLLTWAESKDTWSPLSYKVLVDGKLVGTTAATSFQVPAPIPDGVHHWQAIAVDSLGQETPAPVRRLRIDATPPRAQIVIKGAQRSGSTLTFSVRGKSPSGIADVHWDFGDHAKGGGRRSSHRFGRSGRFVVRATVINGAGNHAVVKRTLHIK